jgi:hypothetical protein
MGQVEKCNGSPVIHSMRKKTVILTKESSGDHQLNIIKEMKKT